MNLVTTFSWIRPGSGRRDRIWAHERAWRFKRFRRRRHAQKRSNTVPCRTREGGRRGAIFLGPSCYRTTETGIKFGRVGLIACMRLLIPILKDIEVTLPRQISQVSWVLSYQVCNREKYKIIISLAESVVSFSSSNIHATRFTSNNIL